MPCKVSDFLNAAAAISSLDLIGSEEATRRAGINRYYLASYHSALIVTTVWGIDTGPNDTGVHAQLIRALKQYRNEEKRLIQKIGTRLADMKSLRKTADYHLSDTVDQHMLSSARRIAEEVIRLCEMAFSIKNYDPNQPIFVA